MQRELSPRGITHFVGRNEVAEALGLSLKTLGREIKRGHIPRPIQISPNRVGWPVDVIQKLLESRIARMTEQAVSDPDKLKPEQVADAAVDFAARHISNELGCRVSPDDVVLGIVRRLSSEDADTLAIEHWVALWRALEERFGQLKINLNTDHQRADRNGF